MADFGKAEVEDWAARDAAVSHQQWDVVNRPRTLEPTMDWWQEVQKAYKRSDGSDTSHSEL